MRSPRVLLVDDNVKIRKLYRLSLEAFGPMRVVGEAGDGKEGIESAARLQPDIVLLDLSMPTMDGLEALGGLRAAAPSAHVVILTGFRESRLGAAAHELGASGFIEKGIEPRKLAGAIASMTEGAPPPYKPLSIQRKQELIQRAQELV